MVGNPLPIDTAIVDNVPVGKAGVRSVLKADYPHALGNADALRATDASSAGVVLVTGQAFRKNAALNASPDDGVSLIKDANGIAFQRVASAEPTVGLVGGVYVDDYVLTPGVGDNTAQLQIATDIALVERKELIFGERQDYHVTAWTIEEGLTIRGRGSRVLGTTLGDIIADFGNGTDPVIDLRIHDLTIWSTVTRTSNWAVRMRKIADYQFDNFRVGFLQESVVDGARLWDGWLINEFALGTCINGTMVTGCQRDGKVVHGNASQTFGVEHVMDESCLISDIGRYGLHQAGGCNVKLDCNIQDCGSDPLRVSDTLGGVMNRETFLGDNFCADNSPAGIGIHILTNGVIVLKASSPWSCGCLNGAVIEANQPVGSTFTFDDFKCRANLRSGLKWHGGNLQITGGDYDGNGLSAAGGVAEHGIDLQNTTANYAATLNAPKCTNNGNVAHGGYGININASVEAFGISDPVCRFNQTGAINNAAGYSALKKITNVIGFQTGAILFDGAAHILPNNVPLKGEVFGGGSSVTIGYVDATNNAVFGTGAASIVVVNTIVPAPNATWSLGVATLGFTSGWFSGNAFLDFGNGNGRFTHSTGLFTSSLPIALPGDPASALHAAPKQYVDNIASGLDIKASVRAMSTVAGTLATDFENGDTMDGVVLATGDRIGLKNQAAPAENGIRIVAASGAPARATDMDNWLEVPGASVWVEEGTANADTAWVCTSNAGGTLNTTAITWTQFGGTGAFQGLNSLLSAISALGSNGIIARTSSSAAEARVVTAGNGTSVVNGDGVSGNPTVNWKPNRVVTLYSTNEDISAVIPLDTSKPQIGEGIEKMSQAFTPQVNTSKVNLRLTGVVSCATAGCFGLVAIFRNAVADALSARAITVSTAAGLTTFCLEFTDEPATASAITYTVRVGTFNVTFPVRFNGNSDGGVTLGGTMPMTLVIEEIPVA